MNSIATIIIRTYDLIATTTSFTVNKQIIIPSSTSLLCLLSKNLNSINNIQTRKMSGDSDWKSKETIYDFSAKDIDGNDVSLCNFFPCTLIVLSYESVY